MINNIFEIATREKYRFETPKGNVSTEDLWQMPMNMLDELYQSLESKLNKISGSKSLFNKVDSDKKLEIEKFANMKDIVIHIFKTLEAESNAKAKALEQIQLAKKIDEIIQKKKDSKLENLSIEQLNRIRDGESVESVIEEDKKIEVSNSVVEEGKDN